MRTIATHGTNKIKKTWPQSLYDTRKHATQMRILLNPGDVMMLDFPGVIGVKRRPAVVVSSSLYHASQPDVIVGLVTSRTTALGAMDYVLQDWSQAGLKVPWVFRCFFATLPATVHHIVV